MDGQAYQDRIQSQLSGMLSTGSTEGTVTGGTFSFTADDMVKIRDNWLELARSYRDSFDAADTMSKITAPAEDMASKFHAKAANHSGLAYRTYLEHNWQYCNDQAQLFQDTLSDYLGVEHTNVGILGKTDHDGPQDGV